MYNRFTDVSLETTQQILILCQQMKSFPVFIVRKSNHPEDSYLYLVLAEKRRSETEITYTVWTYNEEFNSLNNGAYNMPLPSALQNMAERMSYFT